MVVFCIYYSSLSYVPWRDRKPIVVKSVIFRESSFVQMKRVSAHKERSAVAMQKEETKPLPSLVKKEKKVVKEIPASQKKTSKKSEGRKATAEKRKTRGKEKKKKSSLEETMTFDVRKIQNLLEELEEESSTPVAFSSELQKLSVPKAIQNVHVEAKMEMSSLDGVENSLSLYQQRLIEELQQNLHLPEYGEVKVRLKIDSKGTINDVVILGSQSTKNKNYLKNTLPALSFPWWDQFFGKKSEESFTITFRNE
ncbi:MAG: hypothetical protein WCP39_00080 [Chlamydiota bacterium]